MTGRIILIIFTWLLLAAHFSRADNTLLMILSLMAPLLLLIKRGWSLRILQGFTFAGAIVWIYTTWKLAEARISSGDDWIRMAVILTVVALITIAASILIGSGKARKRLIKQ